MGWGGVVVAGNRRHIQSAGSLGLLPIHRRSADQQTHPAQRAASAIQQAALLLLLCGQWNAFIASVAVEDAPRRHAPRPASCQRLLLQLLRGRAEGEVLSRLPAFGGGGGGQQDGSVVLCGEPVPVVVLVMHARRGARPQRIALNATSRVGAAAVWQLALTGGGAPSQRPCLFNETRT